MWPPLTHLAANGFSNTFRANMELAAKTEESADDITAAETAPSPMKETAVGHRYCKTSGSANM